MATTDSKDNIRKAREEYYARIDKMDLSPLWEVNKRLVPPLPDIHAVPHLWDYDGLRDALLECGGLITAAEAQRRVLILENPGLEHSHRTVESMFAGLQLILPGEIAPAHRHSPSALRFIVEGEGAYTAVSGERSYMSPGDFIITPSMTWHDHGHEGDGPMVWMDGLDIPMVGCFGPMFFEMYPGETHPERRPPGDSMARFGANMRPVTERWTKPESPIFNYRYAPAREALEDLRKNDEWDPHFGLKMEYVDPTTGGSPMPTITAYLQLLPKGFKTAPYRTTENSVYAVIEGRGRTTVGEGDTAKVMDWKPRDIFALPCWMPHVIEADEDAVLFSFSDRIAQQKLAIWREEKVAA